MIICNRKTIRILAVLVLIKIVAQLVVLCLAYSNARQFVREHDLRQQANLTGTIIYARPKEIRVGQSITPSEIVEHFNRIGYQPGDQNQQGTYGLNANVLSINSRLPELPSVTVRFDNRGRHILGITTVNGSVMSAQLEPETLSGMVRQMKDDKGEPVWIRRYPLSAPSLVNSTLFDAVTYSEDKSFKNHHGINYVGLLSAALTFGKRGGSSITQQLVKNTLLFDASRTVRRKLDEMFLALAVEDAYSKDEIFTLYANNILLGQIEDGPALYGFAAASEELYGTHDVNTLSLDQVAVLAGLLDKPNEYFRAARRGDYDAITGRRNRVLDLMGRNDPNKYAADKIEQAKARPVKFAFTSQQESAQQLDLGSRHFQRFAASNFSALGLQGNQVVSGLHIYSSMDADLQRAAIRAVNEELPRLDAMFAASRGKRGPIAEDDKLDVALVALNPDNGQILAMVGSRFNERDFNNSTQARRSPGSAIKPFIYAQALSGHTLRGELFTPATVMNPQTDETADGYRPTDHGGGPARARVQLARSDNGAAVVALRVAGMDRSRQFLKEMLGSMPERTGVLAIGGAAGSETTPLQLTLAYSIFATNGLLPTAQPFIEAYLNGEAIPRKSTAPTRVLDPAPAFLAAQMCRSVLGFGPDGGVGTARNVANVLGRGYAIAGKTGTGQVSDNWFVGLTPHLVVGVWIGHPKNEALQMKQGFYGANTALAVWLRLMQTIKRIRPDLLEGDFTMPDTVDSEKIDPNKGCIRMDGGQEEFFVRGAVPNLCR